MLRALASFLMALSLGGCAHFGEVSQFATETDKLTSTVRAEFAQMEALCAQQAELVIVVNDIRDDAPLKDCEQYQAAQGRLAGVTIDVLDNYAKALSALADGKSFDVSPSLRGVTGKLQGMTDKEGRALLQSREVSAVSRLVQALFEIGTSQRREEAVRRLAEEAPGLAINGNILRSFFVDSPEAPPGRAKAPYANLVAIARSSVSSTEAALRGPALRTAEPIRTAELYRELQQRKALLDKRAGNAAEGVPMTIAAAIDAWQAAFADEPLRPATREFTDRLQTLRDRAHAARAAIEIRSPGPRSNP
jgi:hypothetical protein